MAHDYTQSSISTENEGEHPARAIMTKRWQERRAEARAKRMAELGLGDSGLIELSALLGEPAAPSGAPVNDSHSAAPSRDAAAESGEHATATPAPSHSQVITTAPSTSWLRDSRKAMLLVALISNGLLFALLYFGGFLG